MIQTKSANIAIPPLNEGELWAGIVSVGTQLHHVILLPGKLKPSPWAAAVAWAKKQGGELPTRSEQSLLIANFKEQLQGAWYWSCEPHASDASYAWVQDFTNGYQTSTLVDNYYRARAVRKVKIGGLK